MPTLRVPMVALYFWLVLVLVAPLSIAAQPVRLPVPDMSSAAPVTAQLSYPEQVERAARWQLRASNLPPVSPVIMVFHAPDGSVRILQGRSSLLGSYTLSTRYPQVGRWQVILQAGRYQHALEVEVRADTPPPSSPTTTAPPEMNIEYGVLVARRPSQTRSLASAPTGEDDALTLWRLAFPQASGASSALLHIDPWVYLAHGNSLLKIASDTGKVARRWLVSAPITALSSAGAGGVLIDHAHAHAQAPVLLEQDRLQHHRPFVDDTALFTWLRQEADVADPQQRLAQDPTNPWLYVRLATQQPEQSKQWLQRALTYAEAAPSFYTLAALSHYAYRAGDPDLASQSFDAAMHDFLTRGYDPRRLTGLDYVRRYHFPFDALAEALEAQDVEAASFWAPRLWWSAPKLAEAQPLYQRYSTLLADAGRIDQARVWQTRAQAFQALHPSPQRWHSVLTRPSKATTLALSIALLLAALALSLVMGHKYRLIHQAQGGLSIGYWHLFERLSLWALVLASGLLALLMPWLEPPALDASLESGYWSAASLADMTLADLPTYPDAADTLAFRDRYASETLSIAPAIVQYPQLVAERSPSLAALGQELRSHPLRVMQQSLSQLAHTMGSSWLWRGLCISYLLLVVLLSISLVLPRQPGSATSARPWSFYLLSSLVPGSGMCNILWGGLLLASWALLCYQGLTYWLAAQPWLNVAPPSLGIPRDWLGIGLAVVYGVNVLMVGLEARLHHRLRLRTMHAPLPNHTLDSLRSAQGSSATSNAPADAPLPQGAFQVMRPDEPQSWD